MSKQRLVLVTTALALLATFVPARAQKDRQEALRLKTVVIDAGHGGKDAGCVSRDKKTYEKNVALDIATRLNQKISAAYPDVKTIMTRSEDVFVELEQRAVIANKANANLFISIHVNAVEKGTTANGYSVHVLGQSQRKGNDLYSKNLDLVKRENAVILLEDNYQTKYQGFDPNDPQSSIIFSLMQNAHLTASLTFADDVAQAMGNGPIKHSRGVSQDPFWVLWRTAMPSVLIEVGFMTNPDDLEILRSPEGREGIAQNIFVAFCTFKSRYDASVQVEAKTTPEAEPAPAPAPAPAPVVVPAPQESAQPAPANPDAPFYGIQILATGRKMAADDPYFHGYKPLELQAGKLYKYIICTDASLSQVRKSFAKVQTVFRDSYLVKVTDGTSGPVH